MKGSAGGGSIVESEQIVDHLAFKKEWIKNNIGVDANNLVLISAAGDSMTPAIIDGHLLLVDMPDKYMSVDAIYCLRPPKDGGLVVKRIQRVPDGIMIKSDNPAYTDYTIPKGELVGLEIIGRVVWVGRKL